MFFVINPQHNQELPGHSDVRTTMIYTNMIKSQTVKEEISPLLFVICFMVACTTSPARTERYVLAGSFASV